MVSSNNYNSQNANTRPIFASLEDEKAQVKRGLQSPVVERTIWQAIGINWFTAWKAYVNFDDEIPEPRDPESIQSLHPGPIDNSGLLGFGDEIKRSMRENVDFVLLPNALSNNLFTKYGGSVKFPREAVNFGTLYSPLIQVNLFPVRVEIYHCNSQYPNPSKDIKANFSYRYYSKAVTLDSVAEDLKNRVSLSFYSAYRIWLKDENQNVQILEKEDISEASDAESDSNSNKKPRRERMLTADIVERDGCWKYTPNTALKLQEILGNDKECIELIFETVNHTKHPKLSEWPRASLLEKWKNELTVGDVIDARDKKHKWYEAVIKTVEFETGNITVHYKSWLDDFDEVIIPSEFGARIKPYNNETKDRSTWEEGEDIDVLVDEQKVVSNDPDNPNAKHPIWIVGKISNIDIAKDRIQVTYSSKTKAAAIAKFLGSTSTSSTTAATATATTGNDDDIVKKSKLTVAFGDDDLDEPPAEDPADDKVSEGTPVATATATATEVTSTALVPVVEEIIREWYDIYGERVAPLYTHTPKPAKATTSSYSSSYSSISSLYNTGPYSNMGYKSRYSDYYEKSTRGTPPVNGAVGLQNLGNTCFMNSILQCLSNTEALTNLFLDSESKYKEEINYDNPLGHSGKVALSYAKLMKDIWSNAYTVVIPRDFKNTIGEFRPQFAGYEQQDSQEFMNFLLDGLHEDMNRIVCKPHVTKIESKNRPDELIASESLRRFLLRNSSHLVDTCFGQLKSDVHCPRCGNDSVTFDAYLSLSLPIPIKNTKIFTVFCQLLPIGSEPVKVDIEVEISTPMSELKGILIEKLKSAGVPLVPSLHVAAPAALEDETVPAAAEGEVDGAVEAKDGCDANTPPPVPPTGNTKGPVEGPALKGSEENFYFHFGLYFSSRSTSVFKNYNAKEAKSTAISAFVGRNDNLIAFQLEYPVPDFKAFSSSYTATSTSIYGTSYNNKSPVKPSTPSPYIAMDLSVGYITAYNRLELTGYPLRISLPRSGTTHRDIYIKVASYAKRFLRADALTNPEIMKSYEGKNIFEIKITTAYGGVVRKEIAETDDLFVPSPDGSNEIMVLQWNINLTDKKQLLLDVNAFEATVEYPLSTKKQQQSKKVKKVSYSLYGDDDDDDEEEAGEVGEDGQKKKKQGGISIYDCLNKFNEREQLGDTETVYCSKCKDHVAPLKKMDIYSAPDIVIFHLKRFQFISGQWNVHREKINELIDFPIEGLDLSKYVIGPKSNEIQPIYDLYAVSHHMGGLGGGHYVATCKNFQNNKWYKFNDSIVTECDATSAISGTAYVLFYKRRNGSLKWGGIKPLEEGLADED